MVDKAGSYYGTPFKVHRGITQGDPLYPTIFNMVVDAVIQHWVILMTEEEAGLDVFGWAIQWLAAFFYANDSHLTSPSPARIQAEPDVLTGLFGRFGLQTNLDKPVGVVFHPRYIVSGHLKVHMSDDGNWSIFSGATAGES